MAAPGTAYDDPALGKDPQVGHMADYVDTTDDNGGVHLNSGIPNRAFHLAATAIGGTLVGGRRRGSGTPRSPAGRSAPTPTSPASRPRPSRPPATHADAVARRRGSTVGVDPGAGRRRGRARRRRRRRPATVVRGAAYRRLRRAAPPTGEVDLAADDPRAGEVRVAGRPDRPAPRWPAGRAAARTRSSTTSTSAADRVAVPEQHLTDDLRRLAELLLDAVGSR